MKASAVAARVSRNAPILRMNDGGVTFSGGEALLQHEFVEDVCDRLPDVHKAIETQRLRKHGGLSRRCPAARSGDDGHKVGGRRHAQALYGRGQRANS